MSEDLEAHEYHRHMTERDERIITLVRIALYKMDILCAVSQWGDEQTHEDLRVIMDEIIKEIQK